MYGKEQQKTAIKQRHDSLKIIIEHARKKFTSFPQPSKINTLLSKQCSINWLVITTSQKYTMDDQNISYYAPDPPLVLEIRPHAA